MTARPERTTISSIAVFCGSGTGARAAYAEAARAVGRTLAARGITIVYGGASIGLMGIMADAALAAGGRVVGVITGHLVDHEIAHTGLTERYIVGSMHERKSLMGSKADAFLALPGGIGTVDEIGEAATWTQLGVHRKPCGLLNVVGFFDPLIAQIDAMVRDRFLRPEHRDVLMDDASLERLLERFAAFCPAAPAAPDAPLVKGGA